MPFLFLSPSTQEYNPYVTSGSEEYWMNQLANRMEPYLLASGIGFTRNNPSRTAAAAVQLSNAGDYDFHLALHSNAAPPDEAGTYRGIDLYYYPGSPEGLRMAVILADLLREIYPLPDRIQLLPSYTIAELRRTEAPSLLAELGYHDNPEDARWIEDNLEVLAAALSEGVAAYFGVPFQQPSPVRTGTVRLQSGRLNIRNLPTTDSAVLAKAENGATLTIYGEENGWYSVGFDDIIGFAKADYVSVTG